MIGWKTIRNFLSQRYHVSWWRKFSAETLEKAFSSDKKWQKIRSSGTSSTRIFFMFILLISNHTVFLVKFRIKLHLWVFLKGEIAVNAVAYIAKHTRKGKERNFPTKRQRKVTLTMSIQKKKAICMCVSKTEDLATPCPQRSRTSWCWSYYRKRRVSMGVTVNRQIAKNLTVNRQPSKTQYFYRQPSLMRKPILDVKCLRYR